MRRHGKGGKKTKKEEKASAAATPIRSSTSRQAHQSNLAHSDCSLTNVGQRNLGMASRTLQSDREVVLAAVKQNGEALEYASNTMTNDKHMVLAVIKQNREARRFATLTMQQDREVTPAAVRQMSGEALETRRPTGSDSGAGLSLI
ncbi:unnamed protein product [Amoebophrya sp. A25]|nr:unnamed protein product [Amoebophrya sp. A25]|eukprot:GSA25T00015830001.1